MDLRSLAPKAVNRAPRASGDLATTPRDPFIVMRQEMDRLFDGFSEAFGSGNLLPNDALVPKVNVAETADALEITAELPGVAKDDIELDYADGVLSLTASTRTEKEEKDEDKRYYHVERSSGSFMRQFAMPFAVDEDRIEADLTDGVLTISIPRSEKAKDTLKRIAIGG